MVTEQLLFAARCHRHQRSTVQLGSFVVQFGGITNCILNMSMYNAFYVV